jgi:hypothetical protein
MRIFVFKSGTNTNLRAFAGDLDKSRLPIQYRPWHAIGSIAAAGEPPHHLPRSQIEKGRQ